MKTKMDNLKMKNKKTIKKKNNNKKIKKSDEEYFFMSSKTTEREMLLFFSTLLMSGQNIIDEKFLKRFSNLVVKSNNFLLIAFFNIVAGHIRENYEKNRMGKIWKK